jgi:hypothetical protein
MNSFILDMLRERACPAGLPHTGDRPDEDHGHTDCWLHHQSIKVIKDLMTQIVKLESQLDIVGYTTAIAVLNTKAENE